jgi:hypothetical protein
MIDTQRLGALLRSLIRDDAIAARLRTPAAAPVRPVAPVGPELDPPLHDAAVAQLAREDEGSTALARTAARLGGETLGAAASPARASAAAPSRVVVEGARIVASAASPAPPRSAALELSDTGRLLLAALRTEAPVAAPVPVPGSAMQPVSGAAANPSRDAPASAVTARSPLISVPPHSEVATDRLALQLKDAVEFSGVFYESHLAQWADDMRPRALLTHEPQSRWPVAAAIAQEATGPDAATADYATPLLRQQLEVLDTGRFVWRGELWPGQPGTLVIEEEEPPPQREGLLDAPPAPRWRMRLSLEFPRLGAIDATVALAGESVGFSLRCADPAAAGELRGAAATLRLAIAERALDVATLGISHDRGP